MPTFWKGRKAEVQEKTAGRGVSLALCCLRTSHNSLSFLLLNGYHTVVLDHVAQLEYNVASLVTFLSQWPGWRVYTEPGLVWCESAIANEAFNKVIRCELANVDAALRLVRLRDEAFGRGAPLAFWVGPRSKPANLTHILEELGFRPTAQAWGMVRSTELELQAHHLADVEVQILSGYNLWPSWLAVFGQGFGLSWEVAQAYGEQLAIGLGAEQPLMHLAAFIQGKLVGTASMFVDDDQVAGIYNLATAASARGQGVGEALVSHILSQARARGCRWAVLRSTASAYGFYVGVGFQPVARYQIFAATPPATLL